MNFNKPEIIAKVSEGLGMPMESFEIDKLQDRYAQRGW